MEKGRQGGVGVRICMFRGRGGEGRKHCVILVQGAAALSQRGTSAILGAHALRVAFGLS